MATNTHKLTIIHSNDMHGDFLPQVGELSMSVGGLAMLSGYVHRVRREEENTIFVIAGDMVQGSIIDSEYKGVSTIEIMNYLAPDVVTLGNHEFDYGLPHLLFLEKLANFPIVNANLYIKKYNKRLMRPFHILEIAGLEILFIGIITEKVMSSINLDREVGSFITLEEASAEVGRICNAYQNDDIDLTVLLTHIGIESDRELAAMLRPEWGVDMIVGGHSHTVMDEPEMVNGILIAHAGTGTDQVGRFDIVVDDDTNSIVEYSWRLDRITSENTEPDPDLEEYIDSFKQVVDRKYNTIVGHFAEALAHPLREDETPLGNLTADALVDSVSSDVVLVGSGSIRVKELGPLVTLGDFTSYFPYDDTLIRFMLTGERLRGIFSHFMRPENRNGEGECYQVNGAVRAVYNNSTRQLEELTIGGVPVDGARTYTLCLQGYHERNCAANLNITAEELREAGPSKVVSTSARDVLEEYFRNHQNVSRSVEGRLVYR
jgi:5'-nucleotidase / UDP-sugar diphosphatase